MSSASFRVKYTIFTWLIRHKCSDEKSEAKSHQAGANNTNTDGLEQVLNDLQILPQNSSELLHDAVMHNSPGLRRRKPRPVSRISQLAACQDQDSERLSWIPTFCWKGWFVQDRQIWVKKSIPTYVKLFMESERGISSSHPQFQGAVTFPSVANPLNSAFELKNNKLLEPAARRTWKSKTHVVGALFSCGK